MMPGLADDHPSIRFYDGDYPGTETSPIAANLDSTISLQGLAHDVARYHDLAIDARGPILEIGCGTGRVLIPLARAGVNITGIDISARMIDRLNERLNNEESAVRDRVKLEVVDAREFQGRTASFAAIIIPFNGLSCIPDQAGQQDLLENAARLLAPGGRLVVDIVNPFSLPLQGSGAPHPFFTRINPENGRCYVSVRGTTRCRFARGAIRRSC